jgi:3-isopropylmalate dehydrogenase
MLLRYSLKLEKEAQVIEQAVHQVIDAGYRTPDLAQPGMKILGTNEIGDLVAQTILKG